ncbi:MAG: AAA family ATPase [Oligoflexia bacterium]|nr:AAA family ATPase [Oligoflexia bacterium]
MDIKIPGHKIIKKIYEGKETAVYKAQNENSGEMVIFKIALKDSEQFREHAIYEHESNIFKKLNNSVVEGVPRWLALEEVDGHMALVLCYGGNSLASYIEKKGPLNIEEFLNFAIKIANILGRIHQNNIIHKDIKPSNILFDEDNGKIYIIDFNISTLLSREKESIYNSKILQGSLQYISPEQTGRMNRSIDYRSDFYSLGISFYQMLTGKVPFNSENPLDLVHAHIAKKLPAISECRKDVPEIISAIINKLTEKNAEDRYQTTFGLIKDLSDCLSMWQKDGKINSFKLGLMDRSNRFELPQKLYGRDEQIKLLLNCFEKICHGNIHFLTVSGPSGIGKTSLVNEIHRPIVSKFGIFISGKFEQFKRDVPFSALKQAIKELVKQLLVMENEVLKDIKQNLEKKLGIYGRVITDFVPEMEVIFGKLPELEKLAPSEAINRFNLNMLRFFQIIATKKHPIVMFIDDLQWADSASMDLFKTLLFSNEINHLLFIGAYRDNEVDSQHPIIKIINNFKEKNLPMDSIDIAPLKKENLIEMIGEMFLKKSDDSGLLKIVDITLNKTKGNPFFVGEFLKSLYREKIINFDITTGEWNWKVEQILDLKISESVVELMITRIQQFDLETQKLLMLGSCIGCRFSLNMLSMISKMSPRDVASKIWPAIEEGLVVPIGNDFHLIQGQLDQQFFQNADEKDFIDLEITYRFVHDRIQQGANQLVTVEQKQVIHLEMARLYMSKLSPEEQQEKFFDLVNHYDRAIPIITSKEERSMVRDLNYQAAVKGIASMAFGPALVYIKTADSLVDPGSDPWEIDHHKAYLHALIRVESEYLNLHFEEANHLALKSISKCPDHWEKIEFEIHLIVMYTIQAKNKEATIHTLRALKLLGIKENINAGRIRYTFILIWTMFKLRNYDPEKHAEEPEITDRRINKALEICCIMAPAAYLHSLELLMILVMRIFVPSIPYGVSSKIVFAISGTASILLSFFLMFTKTKKYLAAGERILARLPDEKTKGRLYLIYNFTTIHMFYDHEDVLDLAHQAVIANLNSGDNMYAATNATACAYDQSFIGVSVARVENLGQQALDISTKLKVYDMLWGSKGIVVTAQCLTGKINDPEEVAKCLGFKKSEFDKALEGADHRGMRIFYSTEQTLLALIFGEYQLVLNTFLKYWDWPLIVTGSLGIPFNIVNMSICMGNLAPQKSFATRLLWKIILIIFHFPLKKYAEYHPKNFKSFYLLAQAGYYLLCDKKEKAEIALRDAINHAEKFNYNLHIALAAEMLAKISLAKNDWSQTKNDFDKCVGAYKKYGAKAKIKRLQETYGHWVSTNSNNNSNSVSETIIATNESDVATNDNRFMLDQQTVIQSSQVISGEIKLEKLFAKLIEILQKNAGANRIIFLAPINVSESEAEAETETKTKIKIASVDELDIEKFFIRAEVDSEGLVHVLHDRPLVNATDLSHSVIGYVFKSKQMVIENNISEEGNFSNDPYIINKKPKSVLCMPIIHRSKLRGILYFENNLVTSAFTSDRLELLKMLSAQMAVSIENSTLYANLEAKVLERTQQLQAKSKDIRNMLENMKQGVFTITKNMCIHHEYSKYLESLFKGGNIANMPIMDVLSRESKINIDQQSQIKSALFLMLGEDKIQFDLNCSCLPRELISSNNDKILELDWEPIVSDNNEVDKMMVIVRDVTELRELQNESNNQKRELNMIGEILNIKAHNFETFIKDAFRLLEENRQLIENNKTGDKLSIETINVLFRNFHTIKGIARMYNLSFIVDTIHMAEQKYVDLREQHAEYSIEILLKDIEQTKKEIQHYLNVYENKLLAVLSKHNSDSSVSVSTMENNKIKMDELIKNLSQNIKSCADKLGKVVPKIDCQVFGDFTIALEMEQFFKNIFVHLISNSIDHGIEGKEERLQLKKPEQGIITIICKQDSTKMEIEFKDDGRGLNMQALKEKVTKSGHFSNEDFEDSQKLAEMIFKPGISTSEKTSTISGRGVGMDAVKNFIIEKSGTIDLVLENNINNNNNTNKYKNFHFKITLPLA